MIAHRAFSTIRPMAVLVSLPILLPGCETNHASLDVGLSSADTARIEAEVRQALEEYAASVVAGEREQVEAFWGDFDDFIHAGDGRVFGDRDAWLAWMAANQPDETVSWAFSDIHVAVLGAEAASYTANFEVVSVWDGDESTTTGSWTYVLRKTDDGWRVVHSNGKHNEFSYYDQSG